MIPKKVVFASPWRVEVSPLEQPYAPLKSNEIYVQNKYSLISPGTELACLSGAESWFPLPGTPGYVSVGEVLAVGDSVKRAVVGDHVLAYGPHVSHFTVDTEDRYTGICIKVDSHSPRLEVIPFTRAATIPFTAIRVSNIELGDWVLVAGLGIIGNFAAQLARLQGARVIGVDLSEKRRDTALRCGVTHTLDSADPSWKETAKKLAGTRGISTVIDATGLSQMITEVSAIVAPYGEVVLLGSPRAECLANATEIYNRIHLPGFVQFKGALEWRYPTFRDEFTKHSIERNSEIVIELMRDGQLLVDPVFTHKIKPEEAAEAYEGLRSRKEDFLGVVIDWTA